MTSGTITTLQVHIRGLVPCIMSNGAMADPTNEWARLVREIKSGFKRGAGPTEQQAESYYRALFLGQLYLLDGKSTPYWPSENVEGMIRSGAKKTKKGQIAKICLTVDGEYPLIYDGPKDGEALWATGETGFVFKSRIGNPTGGTTINCRPRFRNWEFKFGCMLDTALANPSEFRRWLEDAGAYVGLSAWTPKYGRFEVVSVK